MVIHALIVYVIAVVIVAVLAFAFTRWQRYRRVDKAPQIPPGFERTAEINVDPTTGIRQRVWYNPTTGERFYETLDEPPGR
ncbi:hypothetical protein QTN31_07570 [Alicyclobacillus cycloheptanicus]|nr:hypothetical protein [Alicyclobacillus cycloheptanicus]